MIRLTCFVWVTFIGLLTSCDSVESLQEVDLTPEIIFEDSTQMLHLLFAGDLMVHLPQIQTAYVDSADVYDFKPNYRFVRDLVRKADFSIVNLETTISLKGPYTGYPMFRSPAALVDAVKDAGFDLVCTANNHSNDGGLKGVIYTLDVLKERGLHHTGTFRDSMERKELYPLVVQLNGIRLGVLNATYGTNGLPDIPPSMVNRLDTFVLKQDLTRLKSRGVDFIIAVVHWGNEYQQLPSSSQKSMASFLVKEGVDLIVGMHPHVVQPIQKYPGLSGDSIWVAWSLGNFISNQQQVNTDGGLLMDVHLSFNRFNNCITVSEVSHVIHWRYKEPRTTEFPKGMFSIIPLCDARFIEQVESDMSTHAFQGMERFLSNTRKFMQAHSHSVERDCHMLLGHKNQLIEEGLVDSLQTLQ